MTIISLIKYLWDGVDIPITKEEIQHSVNVITWGLKKEITSDNDYKELNNQYKIEQFDKEHILHNNI